MAICLELCPSTWALQGVVQLHSHCFLRSNRAFLKLIDLRPCCFEGVDPHESCSIGGMTLGNSRSQSWSGYFYCAVRNKIGQLWAESSRAPFLQFLVEGSWIMNMVQANKMRMTHGRDLLIQCKNASRWLRELDIVEQEEEKVAVREAMARAQELLSPSLCKVPGVQSGS